MTLTDAEQAEYGQLVSWWLSWTPPAEAYYLDQSTRVTDPQLSYSWMCAAIREGRGSQLQRARLDHLRRHWRIFGDEKSVPA